MGIPLLLATVACRAEPAGRAPDETAAWASGTVSETGFGPIVVGMTPPRDATTRRCPAWKG
jgi:hypothetical protein